MEKTSIAISACLLGERVRYDGKDKQHALIAEVFQEQLKARVLVIPFCPEVGIGLGVPRDKIELVVQKDESIRVLGVENHTWDVTQALQSYARSFLKQYPQCEYFVVKSRSPSCGYRTTPVFARGKEVVMGSGMFVQTLLAIKPGLHVINESQLMSEQDCVDFIRNR